MKNRAAVEMGKARWAKVSKADRRVHALKMIAAREARKPQKAAK